MLVAKNSRSINNFMSRYIFDKEIKDVKFDPKFLSFGL